ncbi:MAG: hypothetical protein U0790_18205 [Isosphaeraceae bacterium]
MGICVDPDMSLEDQLTHAKDFGLTFPIVLDRHAAAARKLGATMTPGHSWSTPGGPSATTVGSTTSSPPGVCAAPIPRAMN